jgi:hypothetical protein
MNEIKTMDKSYDKSTSKIRVLWETALQLIGAYEEFDRELYDLDTKVTDLSTRLNSTIDGV